MDIPGAITIAMKSLEVVKSLKDIDRQISEAELIVRQLQSLLKRNVIPSCYDGLYHVAGKLWI